MKSIFPGFPRALAALMLMPLGAAALAQGAPALPAARPAPALPTPNAGDLPLASKAYVLSPGDQVEVAVAGHPDAAASTAVMDDGSLTLPIAGTVQAAGLTLNGLKAILASRYNDFNQPEVTVLLRQARVRKVSVLGGAAKGPGQYDYKLGMHLLDLIAVSGGSQTRPDLTQATLVTNNSKDNIDIDMPRLLSGSETAQNLPLAPGDVLFLTPRNASVAQVQISGEVLKPGIFDVPPDGTTMQSLIAEAGGATERASLTQVQLVHNGKTQVYDLRPLLTVDADAPVGKVPIVAGDVVLVPKNEAKFIAAGDVAGPGSYPIPDSKSIPLTEALARVGGATDVGDKKNVNIVRSNGTEKPQVFSINVEDIYKGKKDAKNVAVLPGDIIYVQRRHHTQSTGELLRNLSPLVFLGNVFR